MEENLPSDADPSEWTWEALANWANNRFELNIKEKDLKKFTRQNATNSSSAAMISRSFSTRKPMPPSKSLT